MFLDVPGYADVVTHNHRIRNEYFYDYLRENWKLRKRVLFHVQIAVKIIRMFNELKRMLGKANAHLGENSSSMTLALQKFSVTFKTVQVATMLLLIVAFEIIKARSHNDVI